MEPRDLPSVAEVLNELYHRRCLTVRETSEVLRVDPNTICGWIGKFSIQRADDKRRLIHYSLGNNPATIRFSIGKERHEQRFIVPDRGLLWLLRFALGDGNVGFYPEKNRGTVAPEFAVFNQERALIEKSKRIMKRWMLNPLEVGYVSSGKYPTTLRRVTSRLSAANFWKIKAQSALLPASLLTTRANVRRDDTLNEIFRHREWIAPFVSGFFDAEGRTPRGTGRKLEVPNTSVFNTDFDLMEWIWRMLNEGLAIRTSRIYYSQYRLASKKKRCYCFDITGQWAVRFMREVGFSHPVKFERGKRLLNWNRT